MKYFVLITAVILSLVFCNICIAKDPLITYKLLQKAPLEVEIEGQKITVHVKMSGNLMPGEGADTSTVYVEVEIKSSEKTFPEGLKLERVWIVRSGDKFIATQKYSESLGESPKKLAYSEKRAQSIRTAAIRLIDKNGKRYILQATKECRVTY